MDLISAQWTMLEQKFARNAGRAYRGVQNTLVSLSDNCEDNRVLFDQIDKIVTTQGEIHIYTKSQFTEEDRLIRHLPKLFYSNGEAGLQWGIRDWLMGKSLKKLLNRHLEGLREMKALNKKIAKQIGYLNETPPEFHQRRTDIVMCMLDELSDLVNIQTVTMACVDMKLGNRQKLSLKKMTAVSKIVNTTAKVIRSFNSKSKEECRDLECDEESKLEENKEKRSRSPNHLRDFVSFKGTGEWNPRNGIFRRPVLYDPIIISDDEISVVNLEEFSPRFGVSFYQPSFQEDLLSSNTDIQNQISQIPSFVLFSATPKIAWVEQVPTPNLDRTSRPLSEMSEVYVRVIKAYKAQNKTELSLKPGHVVKQKSPANEDGMAFGWTRVNRFAPKRRGFYPVNCVQLKVSK